MIHPDYAKSSQSKYEDLIRHFDSLIKEFPDKRTGNNTVYEVRDAALGGFSIFFTQSPSFLEYQNSMQLAHGVNNAESMFGVHRILSDNQIRNLLDIVNPTNIFPMFSYILDVSVN